jgi:hypothetical protein
VLSKTRHALVALALLFIAPPLHADTFTTCRDVTQMPEAQCNTLVALYDNTAGANWTNNTGWKQTDTPCSWHGVTCSGGEVTQISLSSNQLTGPIPSLNTLASLQTLNISNNQLCQDSNANYASWTEVDEFPSCPPPTGCNGDTQLPDNLCEGLVAYYPLDSNPNDASGNGNDGTEHNVNYATGVVGNALDLDTTGYIRKENFNFSAENLAVAFWAKADKIPDNTWGRNMFAIHSGGAGK